MAANNVSLIATKVAGKSDDHAELLQQLNKILSDLNAKGVSSSSSSTDIHKTLASLIDDIKDSFQSLDTLQKGASITSESVINTQLAMEQFTVTVTALSKLIGSVEKGVSTLMHGQ
jgi:hypothetical protein